MTSTPKFPLVVFQTGSGTQSNMNSNEVISNRAIELAGERLQDPVTQRPRQSRPVLQRHLPRPCTSPSSTAGRHQRYASSSCYTLDAKAQAYADVVMVGPLPHLQGRHPHLGQVISGWVAQIDFALDGIRYADSRARELAVAGPPSAPVSTPPEVRGPVRQEDLRRPASSSPRRTTSRRSGCLTPWFGSRRPQGLGDALMKIASDVRWYASGPRSSIGEHHPGERARQLGHARQGQPTQCEAMTMVAHEGLRQRRHRWLRRIPGQLQLNIVKPGHGLVRPGVHQLLGDTCVLRPHCAYGIGPNTERIKANLEITSCRSPPSTATSATTRPQDRQSAHHKGLSCASPP